MGAGGMLRTCLSLTCLLSLMVAAPAARAGVADDVDAANRLAMENYDLQDYAAARDALLASLAKLDRAGLADSPTAARTHVLLGVVYGVGLGDETVAVEHFAAALKIDDTIEVDPAYASDATAALLDKGRAALAPPPPAKADCATLQGIAHTIVDRADEGTAVEIACQVGSSLRGADIVLAYQADGAADYTEVPMTARGECEYAASIPAEAIAGSTVRYYIHADRDGKLLASKGRATAPFLLAVTASALPSAASSDGSAAETHGAGGEAVEDEVPDEIRGPKPANGRSGCASCAASDGGGAPWGPAMLVLAAAAVYRRKRR